jgi:hypothetical protein
MRRRSSASWLPTVEESSHLWPPNNTGWRKHPCSSSVLFTIGRPVRGHTEKNRQHKTESERKGVKRVGEALTEIIDLSPRIFREVADYEPRCPYRRLVAETLDTMSTNPASALLAKHRIN